MAELQICPTRRAELWPWEARENLDHWVTDRWDTDPEVVARKHAAAAGSKP